MGKWLRVSMSHPPPWLKASLTETHLEAVLQTLQSRENAREMARSASRRRFQSFTPRIHPIASDRQLSPNDIAHYAVSCGNLPQNQLHNRYLDLEPYDRTRVAVGTGDEESASDGGDRYLNANWVRELFGGKWWIATQAPLPQSTHVFLTLILQPITCPPPHVPHQSPRKTRVRTVVQLTQNIEQGRRKAHAYFPTTVGHSQLVAPEPGHAAPLLKVTLLETRTVSEAQCLISTVSLVPVSHPTSAGGAEAEPVVFRHLLYWAWPDHGVPSRQDRPSFLEFTRLVERTNKDASIVSTRQQTSQGLEPDPDPPIIVNCSAGVGRTGAFIALSSLLRAHGRLSPSSSTGAPPTPHIPAPSELSPSPLGPLPNSLLEDLVAQEIDSLREQRPSMVQRDEQILLIYDVLINSFSR